MTEFLRNIFNADFIPHGHCYLWRPDVLWLHVLSDTLIALAYYSIPVALVYFVRRRRDLAFDKIFFLFAAFIFACGTTHLLEVWTVWIPVYRLAGVAKALTALVSVITAVALWRLIPLALALPSPELLREANRSMENEIARRSRAEDELRMAHGELERRVLERTAELARVNDELRAEVAERGRVERNLRNGQRQLQAILDHSPAVIYLKDPEGRYLLVNREFGRLIGASVEDVPGKTSHDYFPKEQADRRCGLDRLVMETREPLEAEEIVEGKDGSHTYASIKFPLLNEEGIPYAVCGIDRDITESKRAETAIRQAKEEAESASRAKSDFLSRMSHELRTPMNAILGFAQLLEMDSDLSASHKSSIEQILFGGRHLLDLINEVLEFTKIEAGQISFAMEAVQVNEVLQECANLIRPLAKQRQIRLDLDGLMTESPWACADRQRLKQVMLNLLSNAVKYNRPAGFIRVWCERRESSRWRITVADSGTGIAERDFKRVFDHFERLGADRGNVPGTGLGLAFAKRFVELMDGSIGVESTLGEGSEFWIELAAVEKPKQAEAVVGLIEPPGTATASAGAVLYIEDNVSNVKLVERIFEQRPNFRLIIAGDGASGLELARGHVPDLILLDLHLPDIPAEDVLARLKANPDLHDVPVVILTADASAAERKRMLASGAAHYLTKPIDIHEFLRVVDGRLFSDAGHR
jgi:PAS domain S-box-containing protein